MPVITVMYKNNPKYPDISDFRISEFQFTYKIRRGFLSKFQITGLVKDPLPKDIVYSVTIVSMNLSEGSDTSRNLVQHLINLRNHNINPYKSRISAQITRKTNI